MIKTGDELPGNDLAAQLTQDRGHGIHDALRAALHDRPAHRVRGERQHQPERGGAKLIERQHAVSGHAGKKRAGFNGAEA